jgi:hypothetical protein
MSARTVLARGTRGDLVEALQRGLGFGDRDIDGDFGRQTERAVQDFQRLRGAAATGVADLDTWGQVTGRPMPSLFERCLGLTVAFEGHGYTLVKGNWDGAGLTWGIIGFTIAGGELTGLLKLADERHPQLVELAFGDLTPKLRSVLRAPLAKQMEWADSVSVPPKKVNVAGAWFSAFEVLGKLPEIRALQRERAREKYFAPAEATAARFGLTSELGIALCFDIHVQNGGINAARTAKIRARMPAAGEPALRRIVATVVAETSKPQFVEDVRSRKMTIATGQGTVHGSKYVVENWGLTGA